VGIFGQKKSISTNKPITPQKNSPQPVNAEGRFLKLCLGLVMVEPDRIEPTTSCLQSTILAVFDQQNWLFLGHFGVWWQGLVARKLD
jgi:hypothetical protein